MPLRVLLIDDSEGDVRLVREAIRVAPHPCELSVASDADAGLDAMRRERPQLVLLDLNLPRRSGIEVLTELKADPVLRLTPVVIFTTSASPRDCQRLYALGANSVAIKPEAWDAFAECIASILWFWRDIAKLPVPELGSSSLGVQK